MNNVDIKNLDKAIKFSEGINQLHRDDVLMSVWPEDKQVHLCELDDLLEYARILNVPVVYNPNWCKTYEDTLEVYFTYKGYKFFKLLNKEA